MTPTPPHQHVAFRHTAGSNTNQAERIYVIDNVDALHQPYSVGKETFENEGLRENWKTDGVLDYYSLKGLCVTHVKTLNGTTGS